MQDPMVRSYIRSDNPRMHWTDDLDIRFIQVIEKLGGEESATPKRILSLMGVRDLTISHVKSHLQMYRNKKKEESSKEIKMMREMTQRQSQQYLQIYERATQFIQNQQRLQLDNTEKITPVLGSSNKSLDQSSKVGLNENRGNDVVVVGGATGEEELSLELTLGRKY
ncbi:putative transcription factor MYB-HB-like family [Arabidopsis thaliana]|uniref:HTH myb-type domain-containing protein n=3 Tax=Arabidopsis TaxID=3701 RepID=A0A178USM1_ARATH|nr:Homeodomain-like superfamily protein [Arabidopsis thaliana]KAG7619638.1 Homeobox-like domain superfamily [Arabidopsis suecica]AAD29772.1 hypothetical protein [Arabidopsis thaliana]AEE82400.1 Homeodomain-like superfamily protein [Arabidopsis thaliana]OAO96858.1 hypothetical protein AXX17_AT4G05790 [Arabidopsis thaliana]CAA0393739.1 unnamed protein product [Arabidopsis thaliana]|eukprot:NP_192367.1 Homeodomain-like superfamily protein [Arabidopsis thaliana]